MGVGEKKPYCRNECRIIEMKQGRSVHFDEDKINYMPITQKQVKLYFIHLFFFLSLFGTNYVIENR